MVRHGGGLQGMMVNGGGLLRAVEFLVISLHFPQTMDLSKAFLSYIIS